MIIINVSNFNIASCFIPLPIAYCEAFCLNYRRSAGTRMCAGKTFISIVARLGKN